MLNFTTILSNTKVASSERGVIVTDGFLNITATQLLAKLKDVSIGDKDGSHFLRSSLITDGTGECLSRTNTNTSSMANILVLDCDKRINTYGEILEGAPDPEKISHILRQNNIIHVLYGSYSHYVGNKGNRYRIIFPTNNPHSKEQLITTVEAIITLINISLDGELLANAKENNTWSQPWYYPRKPANSSINNLYFENLNGQAIEVVEPLTPPLMTNINKRTFNIFKEGGISPIDAFNEQYPLVDLLNQYGYKKVYVTKEHQRWLSPQSKSGMAGITTRDNKFFSHHDDKFNDGYWHDAFDLMRVSEGLSEKEAIKHAAKSTRSQNGQTVDEHNKSLANKMKNNDSVIPSKPIPHAEILDQLLKKIIKINFREAANISDEKEKLKNHHFHVITIETILEVAKCYDWSICRNHDFIYLFNGAYWSLVDDDELKTFLGKSAEQMGIYKYTIRH